MKRSNTPGVGRDRLMLDKQKIAFHEAGHAVAIHLYNRQENLPPVYFQIIFSAGDERPFNEHESVARIDGGRLIQSLRPLAEDTAPQMAGAANGQTKPQDTAYGAAFEADIVNLLAGPIAEAKFIAWLDGESFHPQLLTVQALKNYGGQADLAAIQHYLSSHTSNPLLQTETLHKLFLKAYHFVNELKHWKAITLLANYILDSKKEKIDCEEVATILDRP